MNKIIRTLRVDRPTNGAFHELCRFVLEAVQGVKDKSLLAFISNLQTAYEDFDKMMRQHYASPLSRLLADLDELRDMDFHFFKDIIKYSLKSRKEGLAEAANVLDVIFSGYGDIAKKSYPDATTNMSKLIRDLREAHVFEQLKNLQLAEEILDDMEAHNSEFRKVYDQRSDESVKIITGGTFKARKKAMAALRDLVKGFESTIYLGGSLAAAEAAAKIDKLFENTIHEMARRGNGVSHSKGDSDSPTDGEHRSDQVPQACHDA